MQLELLVLRVVHVVGGIFWLGSGLFSTLFFLPALAASRTPPAPVFAALGQRRLFVIMPTVAILTIASGARLMAKAAGGRHGAYLATHTGLAFACAGAASVVALLVSLLVGRPSNLEAARIAASLSSSAIDEPERASRQQRVAELRRRGGIAAHASLALLLVAAVGMSVARYLP